MGRGDQRADYTTPPGRKCIWRSAGRVVGAAQGKWYVGLIMCALVGDPEHARSDSSMLWWWMSSTEKGRPATTSWKHGQNKSFDQIV
jgi:hypothetical protein